MGYGKWLRKGRRRKSAGNRPRGKATRGQTQTRGGNAASLGFEALEDRAMLAVFMVTNTMDLDVDQNIVFGSLRWAIGQANATDGGDTIVFDENIFRDQNRPNIFASRTISLDPRAAGDQLTITQPLQILGPGSGMLTISQSKANRRVFELNIGAEDEIFPVEISGVTISGGNLVGFADDDRGGAIFNRESLTMIETVVRNNSAGGGGGGVYTLRGSLNVERSLFQDNSAGVGGAIMNGADGDENTPQANIANSTFTENRAFGVPDHDTYLGSWGGAIFNRQGRLTVTSCTITGNTGSAGGGLASFGNPLPEDPDADPPEDPPPPTVFTYIGSSIIWRNSSDVDRVGINDDDPPLELLPSVFSLNTDPTMPPAAGSLGFNIVGTGNTTTPMIMTGDPPMNGPNPDFAFPMVAMNQVVPDSAVIFAIVDPDTMDPILTDNAGPTFSFLLDPAGIAVDKGDPAAFGIEQRGRFFDRVYDYKNSGNPASDVGSVELQQASFTVDLLRDEIDRQFSGVYTLEFQGGLPFFTILGYEAEGDFSLREAIDFARKNPELDTIDFSASLRSQEPPSGVANNPTIRLTFGLDNDFPGQPTNATDGALIIDDRVIIQGPTTYTLEIDASGNDKTPTVNEGNGSRVFLIDDGDPTTPVDVEINNLTIMGADVVARGAGISNRENLTLNNVTLKDNNTTDDGGALLVQAGTVVINNSTFNNNRAADDGGAIFVETLAGNPTSVVNIVNSTFSANLAGDRGGAIHNANSTVSLSYSTVTLNTASSTRGSGIWNAPSNLTPATPTVVLTEVLSSIISANSSNNDVEVANGVNVNTIVSKGFNLVGGGNASPANPAAGSFNKPGDLPRVFNPMLGPLLNTGGPTETHRPLTGSPVIDAGDAAAKAGDGSVPDFDQRGADFVRVFDGNLDSTARIDIGAYELQGSVFTVSSDQDENDGNLTLGFLSLREAIQLANDNPLPDEIIFDPLLVGLDVVWGLGGTFAPNTTADMKIKADLKITGPGSGLLALDLADLTDPNSGEGRRAFTIDDLNASTNINVEISGLELRNSLAVQAGGAILSRENLKLTDIKFFNNSTIGDGFSGGAIFIEKPAGAPTSREITLTIDSSLLTGNHTDGINSDGGAIYAKDVAVYINNYTTISGNSTAKTTSDGAGVYLKSTIAAAPANFDLNAAVDGFDFLAWQRGFGLGIAGKIDGDATGDGVNNGLDFTAWKAGFGTIGNQGGILNVDNSSITGNLTASGNSDGAGVFSDAGQMQFTDAVISGNRTTGSNSEGAGIAAVNSTIGLVRTVVSLNETFGSTSPGAGIYVTRSGGGTSSVTLSDSLVSQNVTHGQLSNGGGVAMQDSTVIVRNSVVDSNRTTGSDVVGERADDSHGGGLSNLGGTLFVVGSTVSNNRTTHANSKGGGIYSDTNLLGTRSTQILNSTVSGNIAGIRGGGVFNADGLTDIKHSTITNNSTPFFNGGSGIASVGNALTNTRVTSSIIAGNQGTVLGTQSDLDFVETFSVNSFESGGFNLLGSGNALGDFAGGGNITGVTNAGLVGLAPLADNGGQDLPLGNPQTHALLAGSLAKNAGNPAFNPNSFAPPLSFDQRGAGFPRVVLGTIDIGAFESPVFPAEAALVAGGEPAAESALTIESEPADLSTEAVSLPSLASTAGLPSFGFTRVAASNWLSDRVHVLREPESAGRRLRSAAFDAWPSFRDDLTLTLAGCDDADDADDDGGVSVEDAAFAMLADGLDQ